MRLPLIFVLAHFFSFAVASEEVGKKPWMPKVFYDCFGKIQEATKENWGMSAYTLAVQGETIVLVGNKDVSVLTEKAEVNFSNSCEISPVPEAPKILVSLLQECLRPSASYSRHIEALMERSIRATSREDFARIDREILDLDAKKSSRCSGAIRRCADSGFFSRFARPKGFLKLDMALEFVDAPKSPKVPVETFR